MRFAMRIIMRSLIIAFLFTVAFSVAAPVANTIGNARPNNTSLHNATLVARRVQVSHHHNAGFVNAAGLLPFELQYADKEKSIIEAFGENYTFTDLFSIDDFRNIKDEPSISDINYFEFSNANLEASQQDSFYTLWSILAQMHPEFKQRGEWSLFATEFMNTKNFQCSFDNGKCHGMPSLLEIRQLYPGNRPFARLVYFTAIKMELIHNLHRAVEVSAHDLLLQG